MCLGPHGRAARRTALGLGQRAAVTLVVAGAARTDTGVDTALLRRAIDLLAKELSPSRAAAIAAQLTGATRAEAYALIQQRNPAQAPESD